MPKSPSITTHGRRAYDAHEAMARAMFRAPPVDPADPDEAVVREIMEEDVTPSERSAAKIRNFALIYGMSPGRLGGAR